jgi:predicted amidophosphoribosyltransferase
MCQGEQFAFERVIRLGVYDGALRHACLTAKQPGAESLAAALAEMTWQSQVQAFQEARADVVVPVPQFWAQRFTRRHHAADTVAHVWGARLKLPVAPHILRKLRWTRPQARLTPSERRKNLRGAFAAVRDALHGASVLLADDVMTTGATVHESARQLRKAGAQRVVVAVVARGLGRR